MGLVVNNLPNDEFNINGDSVTSDSAEEYAVSGSEVIVDSENLFSIIAGETMSARLQLQDILEGILGAPNVYFQPPASIQMQYPCIVYSRDGANTRFADNIPYKKQMRYQVTVIDRNPDSVIPGRVAELPTCSYDRFMAVDNLNHDVFTLYF